MPLSPSPATFNLVSVNPSYTVNGEQNLNIYANYGAGIYLITKTAGGDSGYPDYFTASVQGVSGYALPIASKIGGASLVGIQWLVVIHSACAAVRFSLNGGPVGATFSISRVNNV